MMTQTCRHSVIKLELTYDKRDRGKNLEVDFFLSFINLYFVPKLGASILKGSV